MRFSHIFIILYGGGWRGKEALAAKPRAPPSPVTCHRIYLYRQPMRPMRTMRYFVGPSGELKSGCKLLCEFTFYVD